MKSLGDLLQARMAQSQIAKGVQASAVIEAANRILSALFGSAGRQFSKAIYLKNKSLTITCLSSVIAQEIKLNEKRIIDEINKSVGERAVEKLRYLG